MEDMLIPEVPHASPGELAPSLPSLLMGIGSGSTTDALGESAGAEETERPFFLTPDLLPGGLHGQ